MPTREEYANMINRSVQGFDGGYGYDSDATEDSFGADDPIKRGGFSTIPIQFSIANTAALAVDLLNQGDVDAAALPTGVATPALANYKKLIKYLLANPSQLQSILLQSSESASTGAPVLASMVIQPKRDTPFGLVCSNQVQAQAYQTTQDFQANRVTVPLKVTLDSFTFLNFTTGTNSSGATVTINATFMIGKRVENRRRIQGGSPMTMRPGGRGPAPVR